MSIPTGQCFKWTSQTPSTPFHIKPFSKNFGWQKANYCKFSPLFMFFMPWSFLYFLIIIPHLEIYLSSFFLLTCTKVIGSLGPFLLLFTFMFYVDPLRFFSFVSSPLWLMTPHIRPTFYHLFCFLTFHLSVNICGASHLAPQKCLVWSLLVSVALSMASRS